MGALTVGVGAAVVTGQGVASASPSSDAVESISIDEQDATGDSGPIKVAESNSDPAPTDAPTVVGEPEPIVVDEPVSDSEVSPAIPVADTEPQDVSAVINDPTVSIDDQPLPRVVDESADGAVQNLAPSTDSITAVETIPRPPGRSADASTTVVGGPDRDGSTTTARSSPKSSSAGAVTIGATILSAAPKRNTVNTAVSAPETTAPQPTVVFASPAAQVQSSGVQSNVLTLLGLTPSNGTTPTTPVGASPYFALVWGLTRRFQSTFFNESPYASPTVATPTGNGTVTGNIGAGDPDGDPLLYSLAVAPSKGTIQLSADGSYVYTASPLLAAAGGTDSFTVTVTEANAAAHIHGPLGLLNRILSTWTGGLIPLNDGSTTRVVVPVSITAGDGTPVVATPAFTYTVDPNTAVVNGRVNVVDPDADPLRFTVVLPVDPSTGLASLNSTTGQFVFHPTAQARHNSFESAGTDGAEFTVSVTDGKGFATTVVVSVPIVAKQIAQEPPVQLAELAQLVASGQIDVVENSNGQIRTIDGKFIDGQVKDAADSAAILNRVAGLIGAPAEFADTANITSKTVQQVRRDGTVFTETYFYASPAVNGVRVIGSQIVLITNTSGEVTGLYSTYDDALSSVDIVAAESMDEAEEAIAAVKAAIEAKAAGPTTGAPRDLTALSFTAEKVIVPDVNLGVPTLAWQVKAVDTTNRGFGAVSTYFVGANGASSGTVIHEDVELKGASAIQLGNWGGTSFNYNIKTEGNTLVYEGVDPVSGQIVRVYESVQKVDEKGNPVTFEPNTENDKPVRSPVGSPDLRALTALRNVQYVEDHYRNALRFNTIYPSHTTHVYVLPTFDMIAGSGTTLDESSMAYGYGSESARDIVAHEYTHIVVRMIVDNGGGFNYNPEGYAMSEAYADLMGNLIENKPMNDRGRFDFGEDMTVCDSVSDDQKALSQCAFRNNLVPGAVKSKGNDFHFHYDDFDGSKGNERDDKPGGGYRAYDNSTIFSSAVSAAMADDRTQGVTSLEWERVVLHSLYKLSVTSGFTDARSAIIGSAKAQGFSVDEIQALQKGFDDVGIVATNYRIGASVSTSLDASGAPIDIVTSADGKKSFVIDGTNALYVVDTTASPKPDVVKVELSSSASDLAVNAAGTRAYVANGSAGTVTVVDYSTGVPIETTVIVGGQASRISTSDDGRRTIVVDSSNGTATVLDFDGATTSVSAPIKIGTSPVAVAISATGSKAIIGNYASSTVTIINEGGTQPTQTVAVSGSPRSVVISANGTRAMVYNANGSVDFIDLIAETLEPIRISDTFDSYGQVGFMAISADGTRGWITNHSTRNTVAYVDLKATQPVVSYIDINDYAHSIATTADGKRAFVVTHGKLYVIDVSKHLNDPSRSTPYASNIDINNNASDYQQVTASRNGSYIVATNISGDVAVLYGTAF
ncbi:Ig-like domain-containing protein [Rhodococcus sp. 06-418-5]|uniref:Ig-like domain-containing protein n=1 Tax=Rhodococcus sp. 06-418-5 TaxID=2022507 RepID=UPI0015C5B303|nr:M4 family metallopeptidase [Rhodococcus sp. 06-418-5]